MAQYMLFEMFIVIGNKHIQGIQVYIIFRQVLEHNDNSKVITNDRRTVQIGDYIEKADDFTSGGSIQSVSDFDENIINEPKRLIPDRVFFISDHFGGDLETVLKNDFNLPSLLLSIKPREPISIVYIIAL